MENNDTMDIDGEKDTDMNCSNVSTDGSDDMDSSEEEAQEKEWNTKKLQLQERVRNPICKVLVKWNSFLIVTLFFR